MPSGYGGAQADSAFGAYQGEDLLKYRRGHELNCANEDKLGRP